MSPRVSVVIPSFNNEDYIAETVHSVLAQSFEDFELVIADHSSSDGTWAVLQQFTKDPRVRLLTTETGGGAERNWNRVTAEATGELVKLVCGDDILYPESLAVQVAAFDANPGATLVASPRDIVDANGASVVRNHGLAGLRGRVIGTAALRRSVLKGTNIFGEPCCVMMRRDALTDAGGWHGDPGYLIDQATYARVLLRGDLVATEGPLAAFRISATQWSVRLTREQAASAAEMHRQLAELAPGTLSSGDVRRGNAMALIRSWQRRLVYLYLGRRMSPKKSADQPE